MVSRSLFALFALFAVSGCVGAVSTVAHAPFTAVSIATVPFRAGGKVVDWTTTSPSERDRAYVRRQRKAAERDARERRALAKRCRRHADLPACRQDSGPGAGG
jgi:hypothetical protein